MDARLKRQTTAEMVADALRRWIIQGEFAEGEQLRQEAIALRLDVSRIPVREALKQLEAEGLVTLVSHKGAVVAKLSAEEISELFEVRVLLETWLLGLAIPRMRREHFETAEGLLDSMLARPRIEEWGSLNWRFHEALYVASGRHETLKILRRIHNAIDRYVRFQISVTDGAERANREHRQILELCRKKDTLNALRELERHISAVKDMLLEQFPEPARAS